jgi:FixJ family two-component response regulator
VTPWFTALVQAIGAGRFVTRNGTDGLTEVPLISIVDDDDLMRTAIEDLVRSLGFSARTFASAESFLQSSSVAETRCLILDVQMPKMSGLDLQDHLSQRGIDVPIIFITAYPDEATKARALNAGAICFLYKPLDLQGSRLVHCLNAALRRRDGPAPAM